MKNQMMEIIKRNEMQIKSIERGMEYKLKEIKALADSYSAYDIITFMESKVRSLKEKDDKIKELSEQNRMLKYLISLEEEK